MRRFYIVLLPFIFMMLLALFLSFAALFICDGYYPVGWGWMGTGEHIALWAMPICVVVGTFMASWGIRRRVATALLLAGTLPGVVFTLWLEIKGTLSSTHPAPTTGDCLRLVAPILAVIAVSILIGQAPSFKASKV